MFKHHTHIYLHYTDAAGRLFFANQFYFIHEAKEHFLASLGLPIKDLLEHPDVTFPIVHAEADYKAVLIAGDEIDIAVGIEKLGETSVVFKFSIFKGKELVGTAKTVSVSVSKATNTKAPLPVVWRKKFETVM
jgi:1,4-dihydroxy-2-naphthoyl-CoA hydrolase